MSNIFQTLELEAFRNGIQARTKESRAWFRKKAADLGKINRNALMREQPLNITRRKDTPEIGSMYMFFYDPKYKDVLPFYDQFPLIIMVSPAENGFVGLNLHYLPPTLRAKLLDGLMDNTSNKKFDETTKFRISYQILQRSSKLKYFRPCYKRYLTTHVKSRLAQVESPEWEIATFLPTAQWANAGAGTVYRSSRELII